jgi:hypothetical protein
VRTVHLPAGGDSTTPVPHARQITDH